MKPLIAVIADDLTGICDTGAEFASAGLQERGRPDLGDSRHRTSQLLRSERYRLGNLEVRNELQEKIIAGKVG
jgi:hypothetical protein